jgi:hypothetical protein
LSFGASLWKPSTTARSSGFSTSGRRADDLAAGVAATPATPHQSNLNTGGFNVMAANDNGTPEQRDDAPRNDQPSAGGFSISGRTLLIGGAGGGGVLAIVIVVVLLFVTGVIGGGNPYPSSVLDLVPDDVEVFTVMDVARILDNDHLADEFFNDSDWDELEGDMGVNLEDLSEMVMAAWEGGEVHIISGNFDLDHIRDELEDHDNEENFYRGYEVWEAPDGSAGALLNPQSTERMSVVSL